MHSRFPHRYWNVQSDFADISEKDALPLHFVVKYSHNTSQIQSSNLFLKHQLKVVQWVFLSATLIQIPLLLRHDKIVSPYLKCISQIDHKILNRFYAPCKTFDLCALFSHLFPFWLNLSYCQPAEGSMNGSLHLFALFEAKLDPIMWSI